MKRTTLLLLTPLLLAGCVRSSASYYIDGPNHSLSLRAEQEYFWNSEVVVKLVAARLPDCQRQFPMTTLPADALDVELYSAGDNVYSVRVGKQVMRIETGSCTRLTEPTSAELGQRLGAFKLNADKKLVFEKDGAAR
ncbi:MAG: hypothetical protein JWQ01_4555 [Massilia sp.]|jgi:hypothetical protein|nr:hypothetical protein [Massilia sp.]